MNYPTKETLLVCISLLMLIVLFYVALHVSVVQRRHREDFVSTYVPVTEKSVRDEIQIIKTWLTFPELHCETENSYPSPSNKPYPKTSFCKPIVHTSGMLFSDRNRSRIEKCLSKSFPIAFGIQCSLIRAKNNMHQKAADGSV